MLRGPGNIHISFIGRAIITFRGEARASEKGSNSTEGVYTPSIKHLKHPLLPFLPPGEAKISQQAGMLARRGSRSRFIFTHVKHARRRRSNDRSSGTAGHGTGGGEKNGRRAPGKIPGRVEARSPTQIPEEQLSQEAIGPRLNTTLAFHRQARELVRRTPVWVHL